MTRTPTLDALNAASSTVRPAAFGYTVRATLAVGRSGRAGTAGRSGAKIHLLDIDIVETAPAGREREIGRTYWATGCTSYNGQITARAIAGLDVDAITCKRCRERADRLIAALNGPAGAAATAAPEVPAIAEAAAAEQAPTVEQAPAAPAVETGTIATTSTLPDDIAGALDSLTLDLLTIDDARTLELAARELDALRDRLARHRAAIAGSAVEWLVVVPDAARAGLAGETPSR